MMPTQHLLGSNSGTLVEPEWPNDSPLVIPRMGRALASGDLDNDGQVDALLVSQNEPLIYFHQRTKLGHFLTLRLEGTRSNRDAIGARVTISFAGNTRVSQRFGGGSYQSSSDPRIHFGLGETSLVDSIQVRWPSGQVDRFYKIQGDSAYLVRESDPVLHSLRGWPASSRRPETSTESAPQ